MSLINIIKDLIEGKISLEELEVLGTNFGF
jgi:hypothetical protein